MVPAPYPVEATNTSPPPRSGTPQRGVVAGVRRFRPDWVLFLALAFTWVAVWRIQDLVRILAKVQAPIMTEVLAVGTLFAIGFGGGIRGFQNLKSAPLKFVGILFVTMVLSVPMAIYAGKSVIFLEKDFIPTMVLMLLVALSVRSLDDLEWLLFGTLAGGIAYSAYIYVFFPTMGGRLQGLIYYDSNDLGLLLVCSIPLALYFARPGVATAKRIFALGALAWLMYMVIRSGSRGAFLGLIAVTGYILLRYRAIPTRHRVSAVAIGVVVFSVAASGWYWKQMETMLHPNSDYNMTEETGRKKVWLRGLGYIAMRPAFGVGVRNFAQAEGHLSEISKEYAERGKGLKWSAAHNSFLEIAAECGVVAFIAFVGMIASSMRLLWRMGRRARAAPRGVRFIPDRSEAMAQAFFGAFIGYIVAGFFVSAEYFAFLYVLIAFVVALDKVRGLEPVIATASRAVRRPRRMPARAIAPAPLPVPWYPGTR